MRAKPPAYPALFDLIQVLPLDLINGLRKLTPEAVQERVKRLDMGNDYLRMIYLAGDAVVRGLAAQFLKSRLESQGAGQAGRGRHLRPRRRPSSANWHAYLSVPTTNATGFSTP